MPARSPFFDEAIRRFDEENARDPNRIRIGNAEIPYELFYAQQVSAWVLRLDPGASEELLLAARCQHICRWMVPRNSYPEGRAGYLKWRSDLKRFHAAKAGEILHEVGYGDAVIKRVQALNLKNDLSRDPEVQTLEDALCLVTLEHQLADLMKKTAEDKMVSILQKTWRKMSGAARAAALELKYSPAEHALLQKALAPSGSTPE